MCVLIVVAFLMSLPYTVGWSDGSVPFQTIMQCYGGRFMLHVIDRGKLPARKLYDAEKGWGWGSHWDNPIELEWLRPGLAFGAAKGLIRIGVNIPLWLPFLLVLIPTAYLWYREWRTIPLGHCQKCGYDLTGNESGRCPECGPQLDGSGK